jgi:hypothetical protein
MYFIMVAAGQLPLLHKHWRCITTFTTLFQALANASHGIGNEHKKKKLCAHLFLSERAQRQSQSHQREKEKKRAQSIILETF